MVGDQGVSVFRSVGFSALADLMREFRELTDKFASQTRGDTGNREPAVTQLQIRETKSNSSHFGHVAVTDAQDAIYRGVPSLRRNLPVIPASVHLFGAQTGIVRPVCITFDNDSRIELEKQRLDVIGVLVDLSGDPPETFSWMRVTTPHLSLGKISTRVNSDGTQHLLNSLKELLPEELVLPRATIYDPSRSR